MRGGRITALDGVSLAAEDGELIVVVGPSGSGKSTLLRCIAGLEPVDDGRVSVGGRDVSAEPPERRDVAMVFQDLALFPHLSVEENVAFPLWARKVRGDALRDALDRALGLTNITSLRDRRIGQLSGGERQRVALARAVVRRPSLFLLDEPLSSLDPESRNRARVEVRTLQRALGTTALYVTHDQTEAMTMADRLVVLREGRIEQVGTPEQVYDEPATPFVARFIGSPPMNVLRTPRGGGRVGIRAEHARLVSAPGRLTGTVTAQELVGSHRIVHLHVAGEPFAVITSREADHQVGEEVGIDFDDRHVRHFPGDGA